MVPYGLYLGGAVLRGRPHAFLLSWLSQCSFEPPLVMMGLKRDSHAHAMVLEERVFSVNVLDASQKAVAASFLKHADLDGDRLAGHRFQPGKTGCPVFDEAAAWLECKVLHTWEHGDHTVVVGQVVEAGVRRAGRALTHADTPWHYGG